MNTVNSTDPFKILSLARDADETEIRSRYLELVKQFPPEVEPDKFREVRAAYEAIKDPLSIARRLLKPPGDEVPEWDKVIEVQRNHPPRLTAALLLSLGNRAAADSNSGELVNSNQDPQSSVPARQTSGNEMTPSDWSSDEVDAR